MTLRETLRQLPDDFEVVIRSKTGTAEYTDKAGYLLDDDGKVINLDDFELITEIHLPEPQGAGTLADLMGKDLEPVRFVINELVPEGLVLLAGKPKLGKSWLALGMALAICSGADTLGHGTAAADVLYIALEDGERRLQDRVRILDGIHMHPDALSRFHYRITWPPFDNGGLDLLETWMIDHPDTRLIVVDTYGKIRGALAGKDRYTEEYDLLGRIQTFATKHRIAVVMIHHLRKQAADDWLEQLSGTQAITGAADTLLGLFRERGQMDATLRLVSREVDEKDLALKFDGGKWESMGDAGMYRVTVERGEVIEALKQLGGRAKVSEVAGLLEKTTASTSKLLIKLQTDGLVTRAAYGVYQLVEVVELDEVDPLTTPVEVVEVAKSPDPTSTTSTVSPSSHFNHFNRERVKEDPKDEHLFDGELPDVWT